MAKSKKKAGSPGKSNAPPKPAVSDPAPSRSQWYGLIGIVALCAAVWAFWERPASPTAPVVTTAEPVPQVVETSPTPLRPSWMRFNQPVTERHLATYRYLAREAHRLPIRPFSQSLTAVAERDRIIAACARVQRVLMVANAWEWNAVREVVGQIGRSISLVQSIEQPGEPRGMIMSWVQAANVFTFWPRAIREATEYDLETTVVHEATHAVFGARLSAFTGYDHLELAAIGDACRDVGGQMSLADETNAILNETAYGYRAGTSPADRDSGMHDLPITMGFAAKVLQGDMSALRDFMTDMMRYIAATRYHNAVNPIGSMRCWPSVSIRGQNAGKLFLASDVAPRLVPYLEIVPTLRDDR
jgi:hypothetical protein